MHPSQFVALLSSNPETDWHALTGRDNNTIKNKSHKYGHIWFWNMLFSHGPVTDVKRTLDSKEVFHEKGCGSTGNGFGNGGCRAWHSQMEKTVR
jgi:hypothetical protein